MVSRKNARRQNGRRQTRRLAAPVIATLDNVALATADTASNVDIFAPAHSSTTSFVDGMVFNLRSASLTVAYGSVGTRVYFVVRRVPEGYANPTITVITAISTFVDPANILAYGVINVTGNNDTEIELIKSRSSMTMYTGDRITLQAVSDTTSTNQAFSGLIMYTVDA